VKAVEPEADSDNEEQLNSVVQSPYSLWHRTQPDSNQTGRKKKNKAAQQNCMERCATLFFWFFRPCANFFSFEWILSKGRIPNGGAVVLLRSILVSSFLFGLYVLVLTWLDSSDVSETLKSRIKNQIHVFGVILLAVYTALYARFASQWTYLANLYNSIKVAEIEFGDSESQEKKKSLAQLKAGFLEDAENLHLMNKTSLVSTVYFWSKDEQVAAEYCDSYPGGESRLKALRSRVEFSFDLVAKKFSC